MNYHGVSRHPLYGRWYRMVRRCTVPSALHYNSYGGRGITVCEDWLDPVKYIAYVDSVLGPPPTSSHSIDRIDNDGNYEPGNLRWATQSEQNSNQRQRRLAGYPVGATGRRGIRFTTTGRFQARIYQDGKGIAVGTFSTLSEAVAAREAAVR